MARFTEAFIGYMRRVAAAVVILAASLSSTLSEAMPTSMNLKRLNMTRKLIDVKIRIMCSYRFSAAGSSMITAVTMGGTKVAYASGDCDVYYDIFLTQLDCHIR